MMNEFGKKIKELRGDKSIREASRGIGISHTYLDSLEKGVDPRSGKERKPTIEVLYKIAKYYNYDFVSLLSMADIFNIENTSENQEETEILKSLIKQDNNDTKSTLKFEYEKLFNENLKHSQLAYLRRVYEFLRQEENKEINEATDNGLIVIDVILRSLLENKNSGDIEEYFEVMSIFSSFFKKHLNIKEGD